MAHHLRYGGSTIGRAMVCLASAKLAEKAPALSSTKYAEEGTLAHLLLERAIDEGWDSTDHMAGIDGFTEDMVEGANLALEYIKSRKGPDTIVLSETAVTLEEYPDIAGGTADVQIIDIMRDEYEVIDYKFGFRPVEADSPQLMFYALCAFRTYAPVRLTVIQPRAFHEDGPVRSVVVTPQQLTEFRDKVLRTIEQAETDIPVYRPDAKACLNCPAATICPALEAEALSMPEARNIRELARMGNKLPEPAHMGADRVAKILSMKPLLEEWLKAAAHWAYDQAMSGQRIPGFKLVEVKKRRTWPEDKTMEDTARHLSEVSGADADSFLCQKLLPVTKAQEVISQHLIASGETQRKAKKLAKDLVALTVERKASDELTLVPENDKRPAVNRAEKDFAGLNVRIEA